MKRLCGIPSGTLGPCDLDWGHDGEMHASCGDGFYARAYEEDHRWRQIYRRGGKHYTTDPRGAEDHGEHVGAKPCGKRLNTIPLSWCTKPHGHESPCSAPVMRPVELDDLGPKHRRRW